MFNEIQKSVQEKFDALSADENFIFDTEPDRDKIWEVYLSAFKEEDRQENNCNCCKSFLRSYAGIVGVKNGKRLSLWDFEPKDEMYKKPIQAVKKYINALPIKRIFLNPFAGCGTEKNRDMKREIYWNHFYLKLPNKFVKTDFGPVCAAALDNKNVLERSLNEITDEAVDTVIELINQNSLYRGQEFKGIVSEFFKIREKHKKFKGDKQNFYWVESANCGPAVSRIRNSAIGTLLNNLSEGMELDAAVTAFERVVAPTNYKRPTAIATPKMIDAARKRLEELGLMGSLKRRILSSRDLTADNALFTSRLNNKEVDIFDQLKKETTINPKSLTKVEEITIQNFVEKVLPTAKSVRVLLENSHLGNFVTLVGPQSTDDPTMFKWGNNFSWSYSGEVADSIKERVKQAGGEVNGVLRVSLSWNNTDDLDLHVVEPGGRYKIYFPNKRMTSPSGGTLDVDANGGDGIRENPVENIYWANYPKIGGEYKVIVNQYSKRQNDNSGFEVEVEFEGQTYNFTFPVNGNSGHNHTILTFSYTKKDGFQILSSTTAGLGKYTSKDKWGLKTGQFHKVKAITLSPNHWTNAIGNKHYMFLLDKCVSDEKTRGFYNEFLKEELNTDRKVFELLGSKVEVEPTEDELSGIGFSDTSKASLIVEVEGAFKRTLKIKF